MEDFATAIIIQNANCNLFVDTRARLQNYWLNNGVKVLYRVLAVFGVKYVVDTLNDYQQYINTPLRDDYANYLRLKQLTKLCWLYDDLHTDCISGDLNCLIKDNKFLLKEGFDRKWMS